MRTLRLIGAPLMALGLAGVVWDLGQVLDGRQEVLADGRSQMIINIGTFSHIGIAGAIAAGVGLILLIGDVLATDTRKQGTNYGESKITERHPHDRPIG